MSKESQKAYYTKQRIAAENAADEGDVRARATVSKINKKLGKADRSYTDPEAVNKGALALVGPGFGVGKGLAKAGVRAAGKALGEDAASAVGKRAEAQLAKKSNVFPKSGQTPSTVEQKTRIAQTGAKPGASQYRNELTKSGAAARSLDARAVGESSKYQSKDIMKKVFSNG